MLRVINACVADEIGCDTDLVDTLRYVIKACNYTHRLLTLTLYVKGYHS
jgi:hypothetical protein